MLNIPKTEEEILKLWKDKDIFKKSLQKKSPQGDFVFYEGPPTANGKPGIHHVEARAFKDLIPRYKTMQGFRVERKAGWDTHGLPVELEVEKALGLENKKDVEEYGMQKFNEQCKDSVWKYKADWEKMTERIGFWIDMENPYVTYDNDYIESLWWIIKQAHEKDLLYKGHKVIPHCPRCGTALSSHEVAQGYKNIQEESVYIKFKVKEKDNEYILTWTTTPWTLPGNVALAVGEKVDYVIVEINNEKLILAKNLVEKVFGSTATGSLTVVRDDIRGKDLVGLEYEPLFPGVISDDVENSKNAFKVYPADFVSTEDGTGVVHTAVMYGIEDYELGEEIGLPKVHTVNLDGTFNELVPQWQGKFVKDVEDEIVADLKKRNILYKTEMYAHDYPFCWRCDTPLLYYAKDSWYFKMSSLRDELIKNNQKINWVPSHIKEGRFGEWLREVKDWAISRERYWGTPIPVWVCDKCEQIKVIGSREELGVDEKFDLHRPNIDKIKLDCKCGEKMIRIPEVMDCWFDSGAMPFAQSHYPFENKDKIDKGDKYPADYISEAIDQTRGWFYTLLAIATMLVKEAPYKNVICLGHVLDKKGRKMSKRLGNTVDPWKMIEKYGADAVRWYLYTVNAPGDPKRLDEQALKESSRIFLTLLNVLTFYKMFAKDNEIENLQKDDLVHVLDKWITAKLTLLTKETTESLDKYDIMGPARKIEEFVVDLSTWYVRRSRDRFKGDNEEDKMRALKTLRRVLYHLARLMAPFTPFIAEYVYQEMGPDVESVHLKDWPQYRKEFFDQKVLDYMEMTRKVVESTLAGRAEFKIKVRQPLQKLSVISDQLSDEYTELIKDEVNVKEIKFSKGEELKVKLDVEITPELKQEGLLRELVRTINGMRKKMGLTIQDRIKIEYNTSDEVLKGVFEKYKDELLRQTLADDLVQGGDDLEKVKVNEAEVGLEIKNKK